MPFRRRPTLEVLEDRCVPAVLTVNTLADLAATVSGLVTLRQAIVASETDTTTELGQTGTGDDTIQFAPGLSGTIDLTQFQDVNYGPTALSITDKIMIDGFNGAGGITIAAGPQQPLRLFEVAGTASLTLQGVTLSGGQAVGLAASNNLVYADGGGSADVGGAILNQGQLTILDSTLTGNVAVGNGGLGGAVFNDGGTVAITNSTITANKANGGQDATDPLGGAFGGEGLGGGLFNLSGNVTVLNSTIDGNYADLGGGIYNLGDVIDAGLALNNTIVADNFGTDVVASALDGGSSTTGGAGNLITSQSGYTGSIVSTADPGLLPLGYYGGPTPTMPDVSSSPAAEAGIATLAGGLGTDQRGVGFPRTYSGTVDIGAYESVPPLPPPPPPPPPATIVAGSLTLSGPPTVMVGTPYA